MCCACDVRFNAIADSDDVGLANRMTSQPVDQAKRGLVNRQIGFPSIRHASAEVFIVRGDGPGTRDDPSAPVDRQIGVCANHFETACRAIAEFGSVILGCLRFIIEKPRADDGLSRSCTRQCDA